MIVRLWRGAAATARADEFRSYQRQVGPPNYRTVAGHRGTYMLGRDLGERYEVAMLTLWDSLAAIRAFAGDPVDRARYYPRDFEFLVDPPDRVEHFEVAAADGLSDGAAVARLWRGTATRERRDEALAGEVAAGLPLYLEMPGNRGAILAGRDLGERYELLLVSLWSSLNAVRAFAGDPPERAYYDDYRRSGRDYMLELPERAEHLEVLECEGPALVGGAKDLASPRSSP